MGWFKRSDSTGIFSGFKQGLTKTRNKITAGLSGIFSQEKSLITAEVLAAMEEQLLLADCGIETSEKIMAIFKEKANENKDADGWSLLAEILTDLLQPCEKSLEVKHTPTVILFVGINGAGKTTTIGKMAKFWKQQNKTMLLAAGDTFRAAAVEQLQVWGKKNDVPVIAQASGSDSASVIYDAVHSGTARGSDLVLADTAGRLHTQTNLMAELSKIIKVMQKIEKESPHEKIMVLDTTLGQNTLHQVEEFNRVIGLTGLVLTKLDGSAKGGVVFALADKYKLPIYYIGVGEKAEDLKQFVAKDFVAGLLGLDND